MTNKPRVKQEAWAIVTTGGGQLCHDGKLFQIYTNKWTADWECLGWKYRNKSLDGYKVIRVEI